MFGLGMQELLIILVIVLIVFGVGKLPEIGEGLGKAIRGFKKGVSDGSPDGSDEPGRSSRRSNDAPPKPPQAS
ncbi:MAG: twin-arginine translocase TatA/TatE family subunit [Nitrospirae bacterium]|nr:twin-arginine translocase TatA/TatE family subunit [Nitrospirota bacterium]